MARWLDLSALAAMLLAISAGLAARAPQRVEAAALAEGALACRGVPDEMSAAERRIVELGWPRASGRRRQADGAPPPVFERDGITLILTPPDQQGHAMMCGLMATLNRRVSAADVAAAMTAAIGHPPGPGNAGGFPVWNLDGGQVVAVATVGEGGVLITFWYPRTAPR